MNANIEMSNPNWERGSDAKIEADANVAWDSILEEFGVVAAGYQLGDEVQKMCLEYAHDTFDQKIAEQKKKAKHLDQAEWVTCAAVSMYEAMNEVFTSPAENAVKMMELWKKTFSL